MKKYGGVKHEYSLKKCKCREVLNKKPTQMEINNV